VHATCVSRNVLTDAWRMMLANMRSSQDFLVRSTPAFWAAVDKHLNQIPFKYSAWSEKIFQIKCLWVGSGISADPTQITDVTPPEGEPSVIVNWRLPLTAEAHEALATRVASDYMRATTIIANPDKKKQMRKSQAPHSIEALLANCSHAACNNRCSCACVIQRARVMKAKLCNALRASRPKSSTSGTCWRSGSSRKCATCTGRFSRSRASRTSRPTLVAA